MLTCVQCGYSDQWVKDGNSTEVSSAYGMDSLPRYRREVNLKSDQMSVSLHQNPGSNSHVCRHRNNTYKPSNPYSSMNVSEHPKTEYTRVVSNRHKMYDLPAVLDEPRQGELHRILAANGIYFYRHKGLIQTDSGQNPFYEIILKVYLDSTETRFSEVPITPETTCGDVRDCCKEPGEEQCHLVEIWRGCERQVTDDERPYEILQQWGLHRDEVRFVLRHEPPEPPGMTGRRIRRRNGIREDGDGEQVLPSGVDLTLAELQEMAARQQQQIAAQQQMLVAKEQRLKFLKQQELRHQQIASENERLRKLREKVEAQELKLKKLRALRGQVDQHKQGNGNLTAELETIKTLFNEKEKELSMAVSKVDELTRQLEDLRKGRQNPSDETSNNSPAVLELEKLRKELVIRNKLNEQQNTKLAQHREILLQRKDEMGSMDKRIAELQTRLRKKRMQQQENQYNLANQNNPVNNNNNNTKMPAGRSLTSNIAAVEPYIKHIPAKEIIQDEKGFLPLNKHDPKYKTLPYNIKLLGMDGKPEIDDVKPQDELGKGYLKVDTSVSKGGPDAPSPVGKPNATDLLPKETFHNTSHFTPSLGHTTAFQAMEDTLKQSAHDGSSIVPTAKNIFGVDYKAPTSLSNLAPRPFGTTFSTSMLSGRPSIITTVPQSSPGLSTTSQSPGSFPKTSTPVSGNTGNRINNNNDMKEIFITGAPVSMPSRMTPAYSLASSGQGPSHLAVSTTAGFVPKASGPIYQIASSRPQPLMQPQRTQDPPSPSSTSSSGSVSSTQPRLASQVSGPHVPDSNGANMPPNMVAPSSGSHTSQSSFPPQYTKAVSTKSDISDRGFSNQTGSQNGQNILQNSATTNHVPSLGDAPVNRANNLDSAKPVDPSLSSSSVAGKSETSVNSVSSALSVLMSGTTTTAPSSRPTYRYAPKSVIANTYMKKLGSSTLDQYRQNMNKLYKDFSYPSQQASGSEEKGPATGGTLSQSGHPPGSPTATVRPINVAPNSELDSKPGNQEHEGVKPPIFLRGPPPYPGAPPYNIDPVHYRPNAPKTLRRRLSSGDSDDLAHKVNQKLSQKSPSEESNEEDQVFEIAHHKQPDIGLGSHQPDIIRMDSIQDSYNNNYGNDPAPNQPSPKEQPSVREADRSHLPMVLRRIKGIVKTKDSVKSTRRVSFDPLALLLDASLEGELELVQRTAKEVSDPSAPNDEGITALHNAICAGHYEIVKFLVEFGCNVNAPDSDGWTPLHCAASCNNLPMVKFLVEHGACIFATTISDHETAAEKCEEDEDGYDGCSEYLYSVQEKLGIMNKGIVFAVFDYSAQHNDELTFQDGNSLTVLRKGDENEKDWWWAKTGDLEGYIPRNLLGLYPRVVPQFMKEQPSVARSPQS